MKESGFVDEPFFLNPADPRNTWDINNNKKLYWPSKNPIYFVIQFIHNNIASNIFHYQNYGMHGFTSDQFQNEEEMTEGQKAHLNDEN